MEERPQQQQRSNLYKSMRLFVRCTLLFSAVTDDVLQI